MPYNSMPDTELETLKQNATHQAASIARLTEFLKSGPEADKPAAKIALAAHEKAAKEITERISALTKPTK